MDKPRACIIGTGNIAQTHAEVLSGLKSVKRAAVIDIDKERAERFAKTWRFERVYSDIEAAINDKAFDIAHITTPPDSHTDILSTLTQAGLNALVEKPLATSTASADSAVEQIESAGTYVGVNQNFVHHPAFRKLLDVVNANKIGGVRHINCTYYMPLRQLASGQFGHWMFQHPANLLLEQAVHPLSQVSAVAGPLSVISVTGTRQNDLVFGVPFFTDVHVTLKGPHATAVLSFSLGHANETWRIEAVCEDGTAHADMIGNRCSIQRRGRRLEFIDFVNQSWREGLSTIWQGTAGGIGYLTTLLKVTGRQDPFFLSMKDSISAYYEGLKQKTPVLSDSVFGSGLVSLCEEISHQLAPDYTPVEARMPDDTASGCDVIVLGGSGFIGLPTVKSFKDAGLKVALMARSVDHLLKNPDLKDIKILRGTVSSSDDLDRAIEGVPIVVNLAHGGGGDSWEAIKRALVDSATLVAERCLAHNCKRLIHVGSIAGLYLGESDDVITGDTPPDLQHELRADYARAKAVADNALLRMHEDQGLPLCIVRPGIVVGASGSPFHSGVGFANAETHWFGWGNGENDLPFVLVEDVADALVKAAQVDGVDGRCFNLASDLRLGARAYLEEVAKRLDRPIRFYPSNIRRIWLEEIGKWLVKRAIGRKVDMPNIREFKSRAMLARLDCSDAKSDLDWSPEEDVTAFFDRILPVTGPDSA